MPPPGGGRRAGQPGVSRTLCAIPGWPAGGAPVSDIGPGLPRRGACHEVAQAIAPETRVVYVDNDPLVLAHARALLTSGPEGACDYLHADLHDPQNILDQAARTLDFTRPTAVLLLAILHFIGDEHDPAAIVATLAQALAPGSYIAISHLTADFAPGPVSAGVTAYNTTVPVAITTHAATPRSPPCSAACS